MTNGEKLCIDFPTMHYTISEHRVITTIGVAASFDLDWWNAEYKEPTTKNDLGVECIVDVLGSYTDLDIPYKREIAENILTKLSSVTPIRPKGHWILTSDDDYEHCTCSECGFENGENWMIGSNIKFCQECGAKMQEVGE